MYTAKGFLYQWLTLFVIWVIANASLDSQVLASGAILAALVSLLFARFSGSYREIHLTPRTLYYYFLYVGVFLVELLKANLNVARLVFAKTIDIHPGIVEIKTKLKSRTGRLVLANSITLTPGTLVVDIDGDSLFVHWIDVRAQDAEAATREISARFEKYLEVIYG